MAGQGILIGRQEGWNVNGVDYEKHGWKKKIKETRYGRVTSKV